MSRRSAKRAQAGLAERQIDFDRLPAFDPSGADKASRTRPGSTNPRRTQGPKRRDRY